MSVGVDLWGELSDDSFGPPDAQGLERHGARVALDLTYLGLPPADWPVRAAPDGTRLRTVVVVGAGMNGIAVAGALKLKGVHDVVLLEREAERHEGPWLTYARMKFLRSGKQLPGPAFGVPSLTFRAWFEAGYGEAAWEGLYKIPNGMWVDYLIWLRRMLGLEVRHGVTVERLVPSAGRVDVVTDGAGTIHARHVVLATGRAGAGGFFVPDFVDKALWPDLVAHSYEPIDFARLRGQRIAIIGGASAAWDNAATAVEAGAASVDIFIRRKVIPQVNKGRGVATMGAAFFNGWHTLPDAERWSLFVYMQVMQGPPPHETVLRALRHPGVSVHLGREVVAAGRDGDAALLRVAGEAEPLRFDYLVSATGYRLGVSGIAELGPFSEATARWQDRHAPADPALVHPQLAEFPYLGAGFELLERAPGAAPGLSRIRLVNHAANASHGDVASDIPGVTIAGERAALAIVQALVREDIGDLRARLTAYAEPELEGTPYFVPEALVG
jgi:cation diffusion facilitator CzcD-associated flavoprotein CzcO